MDSIKIPSILIQKEDAENVMKIVEQGGMPISLAIHFPLVKGTDVASLRLIL